LELRVPYASWYGDTEVFLGFPDEWKVVTASPRDAAPLGEEGLQSAFRRPIGTKRISELARDKRDAVLIVDDISRPTPTSKVVPFIIEELKAGGLDEDCIKIIMATAAHRPQVREDLEKKLGGDAVSRLEVFSHNPYENLVHLETTVRGTPIYVNRYVSEADLKIGVGGIFPHPGAGYGGGGKIVLPGVSGMDTIEANHRSIPGAGHGVLENNENRADIEEAARKAGLDIIVNVVINSRREAAGVFVGDLVEAHREGVRLAKEVYKTHTPRDMDIAVVNAYPLDTEMFQAVKALWAARESTKKDSTVILLAACSEGRGYHALVQMGGRLWTSPEKSRSRRTGNRRLWIVSPNLNVKDVHQQFPDDTQLFRSWREALEELQGVYKGKTNVAVFPCAPIQVG